MRVMELVAFVKNRVPGIYYPETFPLSDAPDFCVKGSLTGGFPTDQWTGKKQPTFQLQVRAGMGKVEEAETQAYMIHNSLTNLREVTVGTSSVVVIRAMNSTPIYIGTDENNRPIYTMNFECVVRP